MSGRKSSIGGRQKAHIPFRGDERGHGKRTGYTVPRVPHLSDDFEPFEEVLNQGNPTPPRPPRKRRSSAYIQRDDDDELGGYGEESMVLDETPIRPQIKNANQYPDSSRRSFRTAARSSDIDYDTIPSPPSRSRRTSSAHSAASSALHDDDDLGLGDFSGEFSTYGDGDDPIPSTYDDPSNITPRKSVSATPRRRSSFSQMNVDEDERQQDEDEREEEVEEEEEEEEEVQRMARSSAKGKGKIVEEPPPEDEEVEDDIARGLQAVDEMALDEDIDNADASSSQVQPPKRKPRAKRTKAVVQEAPDLIDTPDQDSQSGNGLRRGTRIRYAPLEWWRNEKVVYGKRENGIAYCPIVKAIVRVPKEPTVVLGKIGKKKKVVQTRKTSSQYNPEEGWDDDTPLTGVVVDWQSTEEVQRRIAFPSAHVEYRAAEHEQFYFQKIFGDGEYIAAGQLLIPPNGQKPTKGTKDNTYVFYVIEGAVTFKVHQSSYILCTGGSILVPRGNFYFIENISDRDAKLFFAQARRISAEDEEPADYKPAIAMESQTPDPAPRQRSRSTATPAANTRRRGGAKRG